MQLITARKSQAQKSSFSRFTTDRRVVSRALSVVLAAQCLVLNMPLSAAFAAEDMSEAAAPSWNEVHSDAAKIMEGNSAASSASAAKSSAATASAAAVQPADSEVEENLRPSSANGKSIAEATRGGAATDAAILTPVQIDSKEAQSQAQADSARSGSESAASETSASDGSTTGAGASTNASTLSSLTGNTAPATTAASVTDGGNVGSTLITNTLTVMPGNAAASSSTKEAAIEPLNPTNLVAPGPINTIFSKSSAPDSATTAAAAPVAAEQSEAVSETAASLSGPLHKAPQVGAHGPSAAVDSLSKDMMQALGATETATETVTDEGTTVTEGGVMVVDSDEAAQIQEKIKYENLETDESKSHIKAGAVFPVVITSQISTKTSKKGDPVEARLKYDLKIGNRLIAHKGAEVHGHINYSQKARSAMHALISSERWYHSAGCLGLEFDELINEKGDHLPLVACPARAARIVKNKSEGRLLGVNKNGQITAPWSQQLKYKAIHIGINAALAPAGVFSFGAAPVALGLLGAANPSFAMMKPVGQNVRHRRLKGFAWGFISGVPGGWLIEDTIVKGQESVIKPGDEFLAEFRQEFSGEPATEAQLMPNASTKVHGQIQDKSQEKNQDIGN